MLLPSESTGFWITAKCMAGSVKMMIQRWAHGKAVPFIYLGLKSFSWFRSLCMVLSINQLFCRLHPSRADLKQQKIYITKVERERNILAKYWARFRLLRKVKLCRGNKCNHSCRFKKQ